MGKETISKNVKPVAKCYGFFYIQKRLIFVQNHLKTIKNDSKLITFCSFILKITTFTTWKLKLFTYQR